MNKYIVIALAGLSLNAFAGGSDWDPKLIDPSRCVMLQGSGSSSAGTFVYNTGNSLCMQGINEGKVKGVSIVEGGHEFNDGTRDSFSGTVTPSSSLTLTTDVNKVNKVGIKRWWYKGTWIK
ncbi:TPA: hypothetical protein JZG45_005175 [Escherichia coli]|nr:hypothetical protein [Escherichia coli]